MKVVLALSIGAAVLLPVVSCQSQGRVDSTAPAPSSQEIERQPFKPSAETDSKVINTAMESFFTKADWQSDEWQSGDLVVLQPKWNSEIRERFYYRYLEILQYCENNCPDDALHARLEQLKAEFRPVDKPKIEVAESLSNLALDRQTVLGNYSPGRFTKENALFEREAPGKVRVAGSVSVPCYSQDGKFAILDMGAAWSMHGARIIFLLEREQQGWKVLHVHSRFLL